MKSASGLSGDHSASAGTFHPLAETIPKPFGFTEYNPHGSENPPGNYDYRRFIAGLEKGFPRTCFFLCWNAKWSLATNESTKELPNHPSVANREDLPARLFKAGE